MRKRRKEERPVIHATRKALVYVIKCIGTISYYSLQQQQHRFLSLTLLCVDCAFVFVVVLVEKQRKWGMLLSGDMRQEDESSVDVHLNLLLF